jgi:hypothetical protein
MSEETASSAWIIVRGHWNKPAEFRPVVDILGREERLSKSGGNNVHIIHLLKNSTTGVAKKKKLVSMVVSVPYGGAESLAQCS